MYVYEERYTSGTDSSRAASIAGAAPSATTNVTGWAR
jgi:hypothetical protein